MVFQQLQPDTISDMSSIHICVILLLKEVSVLSAMSAQNWNSWLTKKCQKVKPHHILRPRLAPLPDASTSVQSGTDLLVENRSTTFYPRAFTYLSCLLTIRTLFSCIQPLIDFHLQTIPRGATQVILHSQPVHNPLGGIGSFP